MSGDYDQLPGKKGMLGRFTLPTFGYVAFALVLVLFGLTTKLDENSVLKVDMTSNTTGERVIISSGSNAMMSSYGMMMDATAMCVMGFGFLYAFCRKYTWGGIVFNFLICGLCFLWCQVCTWFVNLIFTGKAVRTEINLEAIISADLVTAAVLITFGVAYGFVSPSQIIIICLLEPLAMKINEHIVVHFLHTSDAGGSILTHAFGAFFGLGLTLGLGIKPRNIPEENRQTSYLADTFALVGTIVLWMFWPSFNGSLLYDDASVQQRVVVNTYLAICASCVTALVTSNLVHGKLNILEVQNATLAGGVSIGMSCSYNVDPWVPVLIGGLAGVLSSVGYGKIAGCMENIGIMDSAGATQLHGIPGIFGAFAAAIVVVTTTNNQYFAADTTFAEIDGLNTNMKQFGMIIASVLVTMAISFVTGLLNGFLIRVPVCGTVDNKLLIDEMPFFEKDDEPTVYHTTEA